MRLIKIVFFAATIVFVCDGCTNKELNKKRITNIDSLLGEIQNRQLELNEIIKKFNSENKKNFQMQLQDIKNKFGDTLPNQFSDPIKKGVLSLKVLTAIEAQRDSILLSGELCKQQLQALKTDITNNAFDSDSIDQFLEKEKASANSVISLVKQAYKLVSKEVNEINTANKTLDSLSHF